MSKAIPVACLIEEKGAPALCNTALVLVPPVHSIQISLFLPALHGPVTSAVPPRSLGKSSLSKLRQTLLNADSIFSVSFNDISLFSLWGSRSVPLLLYFTSPGQQQLDVEAAV
jgi:hypothetical protein